MKMLQRLPLALVALVQLSVAATAAPVPVTQGDILLGFRVTGAPGLGTYYVVDIGAAKNFRDAVAPITITNLDADLQSIYGPEWQSRSDVLWGVAGTPSPYSTVNGDVADTLYLSRPQVPEGVPGSFPDVSSGMRGTISIMMANALGIGGSGGLAHSEANALNPNASKQPQSLVNNWASFLPPPSSSLDYSWGNIEGTPDQTLSLVRYGTAVGGYLGSFKIQPNGDVVFTPAPPPAAQTYTAWATTNVSGQAANLDFDHDGIPNGVEFFTGTAPKAFTAAAAITSGQISWPRASGRSVTSVFVQTSTNLTVWENATANLATGTGPVVYPVPSGESKLFVRLLVIP